MTDDDAEVSAVPDYGMAGAGNWIVVLGPQADPIMIGPFPDDESAIAWASQTGGVWYVSQLVKPEEYEPCSAP